MAINANGNGNPAANNSNVAQIVKGSLVFAAVAFGTAGAVFGPHSDPGPTSINGCTVWGAEKTATQKGIENWHKNRSDIPSDDAYVGGANLSDLTAKTAPEDYDMGQVQPDGTLKDPEHPGSATTIQGYAVEIKMGGMESCNCETQDPQFMDTHIYIGSAANTPHNQCLIVEVTPRLRATMAQQGVDWSTEALKTKFEGRQVRVSGWLFFDADHVNASQVNNPSGNSNWRASCWEVHPVTDIQLLSPGQVQTPTPPIASKPGPSGDGQTTGKGRRTKRTRAAKQAG